MADLSINDTAARSLGFIFGECSGWRDAPDRVTPTSPVPPGAGVVALATPREQPRVLVIRGFLRGTSKSDVLSKADTLKLLCQGTSTKLAFPDGLSRHITATLEKFAGPSTAGEFHSARKDHAIEMRFVAQKPYFLSDTATTGASGVDLPLGTAPVQPLLSLTGAATTGITFTLRDETNTTAAQMRFPTLTLVGGDTFVVDCEAKTAKKNGTSVIATLNSADDFFTIDPIDHANYGSAQWPDVTVNAGTLTASFYKAWR